MTEPPSRNSGVCSQRILNEIESSFRNCITSCGGPLGNCPLSSPNEKKRFSPDFAFSEWTDIIAGQRYFLSKDIAMFRM